MRVAKFTALLLISHLLRYLIVEFVKTVFWCENIFCQQKVPIKLYLLYGKVFALQLALRCFHREETCMC